MREESEVLATLDAYADAYCAKDVGGLMALFDAGDDVSVIGTGADELCAGQAQRRRRSTRRDTQPPYLAAEYLTVPTRASASRGRLRTGTAVAAHAGRRRTHHGRTQSDQPAGHRMNNSIC